MPEAAMNATTDLPVGPELDAAVARVLGWTYVDGLPAPMFSQTWGDAGKVAEELRRRGWWVVVDGRAWMDGEGYTTRLVSKQMFAEGEEGLSEHAPTLPEAVCRVVLLAADALKGESE